MFLLGSPFPVPLFATLGQNAAYLRSWFREDGDVANARTAHELLNLLRALNPRAARVAANLPPRLLYGRILRECARRFPIQEYVLLSVEEEWDDDEATGIYDTLPVAPAGYGMDDAMPPALVVCGLLRNWDVFAEEYAAGADLLEQETWLREYAPRHQNADGEWVTRFNVKAPPSLPRGRVWRKPWGALHDAFYYALAGTGNPFLDYDVQTMDEAGWDIYPRLTLNEIRASEVQWKNARAMLDAIHKLIDHIGNRPERLRLLADVLMRRPDALRQVTVPKP